MSEFELRPPEPDEGGTAERAFLIADVRGYTRFTRERGDAAAAHLAQAFAGLARDAVEARAGRLIELRGDEALAAFAAPEQAVRAAVELVAVCAEEAGRDPELPLFVGVGIDVGQAVPVEGGFRGAALNTAARLCSQAGAGDVLVTRGVLDRAGEISGIRFEPRGTAELKGFEAPVELIAAVLEEPPVPPTVGVRAAEQGDPVAAELGREIPLVGRERELAWLRGTWRQAERGRGRVLFVTGPAGIGKTRLAAELASFAVARGAHATYAGAGGAASALAVAALRTAASEPDRGPSLLVLDDLEVLGETVVDGLLELTDALAVRPTLIVGLARDPAALPQLASLVDRADTRGDGHRALGPLTLDEVAEVAALYAGEDVREVSLESIHRASGGVPGRVHELMSDWAEQEAARRLEAAAEWLAAGRRDRGADLEFANNVIGLKLARLYAGATVPEGAEGACPYLGLASFEESDARFFFGREQLVGELAARTVGAGLLGVVGASGSGKSSVIAAGLLPSLKAGLLPGSDRWRSVSIRPGEHPMAELRRALPTVDAERERVVLVVDQLEEAFTTCADPDERLRFTERLVALAEDPERAVVVVGLRGDFYGHLAAFPDLARLMAANHVLVGPMSPNELRRVVELPARRARVRVEVALVDRLVSEVADEPGGLPLLSTALVELWSARSNGWLRLEAHERLGGVRGAVARLAESAYEQLDEAQREAARRLFLRLAATGEDGTVTRRRVHVAEIDLASDPVMASIVERLTGDRLLTARETTVEVAHEALLREWPRLVEWLRDDAQGRELREHLTQSAKRWEAAGTAEAELYRGARLSATLDWAARRPGELNAVERAFLAASRAENERELVRQRRQNRRLRTLLAGVGILLAVAVAAGVVALSQRSSATHQATVALGRQLGAEAVSEPRIDRAALLARESLNLDRSVKTEGTLLATLLRSPAAIGTFTVPIADRPDLVRVSPDDRTIAVATNNQVMRFYDTRTHRQTHATAAGDYPYLYLPGTNDLIVSGAGSSPEKLIDGRTGRVLRNFDLGHLWETTFSLFSQPVATSPNGRYFFLLWAVQNPDGSDGPSYIQRWSVARGGAPTVLPMHARGMVAATVTRDDRLVVATDGEISTWDARTLHRTRTIRGPRFGAFVNGAISPDGRRLAYGLADGTVHFVDLGTGRATTGLGGHAAAVQSLGFAPDSRLAASTGDDGAVIVWNPATGAPVQRLAGHAGRVIAGSFSGDGTTLYTASLDGTVLQWDLAGGRRFGEAVEVGPPERQLPDPATRVPLLAVSPDGRTFAARVGPSAVGLFSTSSLRRTATIALAPSAAPAAAAWAGGRLVVGAGRGAVEVWDVSGTPRLIRRLRGLTGAVRGLATADGGRVIAAVDGAPSGSQGERGSLAVWRDGRLLGGRPIDLHTYGNRVAFSRDGSLLAVAADDLRVLVLDARTGRLRRTIRPPTGSNDVAFSPKGVLASGSFSGILTLWNPRTGREIGHPALVAPAPVAAIAFDPNGDTFATSAGSSGRARLWTTATLQQLGSDLPGGEGQWGSVAYTPDGRDLLVAFGDGTVDRWPATVSAWEQHACAVAGRNFTREEWSRLVGGRAYARVCR